MRPPNGFTISPEQLPILMNTLQTVSLLPCLMLLSETAVFAKEELPKLELEALSLMLSKAEAKPSRPNMFTPFQGGSPGGIQIVAKATSDKPIKRQLVPSEVEITSFTDDRGTNLLSTKKERVQPGPFGGTFRSLEVSLPAV